MSSGATDIGTGTGTVMTQLAAEVLGLDTHRVKFKLGDTRLPQAPQAGGSGLTAALGSAVHHSCVELVQRLLALVADDRSLRCAASPTPRSSSATDWTSSPSMATARRRAPRWGSWPAPSPSRTLGRFGRKVVGATRATVPAGAFGARFVEVRVDPELGLVWIARIVSAIDAGRVVNEKLARSQIIGGTVGGIGMALLEDTMRDPRSGRIANATDVPRTGAIRPPNHG